jgi:mono/diheme cytochrome c family protein
MFTVPTGYNFHDPVCRGVDFICWPTVGASSIEYYASKGKGIPGWDKVLLVTTLKRGSLYVLPLTADGKAAAGHFSRYFQSENRYRDTAVSPDGRTIYIATDSNGLAEALAGGSTGKMQNPGAILAFTYVGEGTGAPAVSQTGTVASNVPAREAARGAGGLPPQFTAEQAAAGKTAWNANCAACHGNTMTNGTFGPPLAGEYFSGKWAGLTVRALYDKARTMPPSAPASLPDATYLNIVAYVLQVNGFKAGDAALPAGGDALDKITVR